MATIIGDCPDCGRRFSYPIIPPVDFEPLTAEGAADALRWGLLMHKDLECGGFPLTQLQSDRL